MAETSPLCDAESEICVDSSDGEMIATCRDKLCGDEDFCTEPNTQCQNTVNGRACVCCTEITAETSTTHACEHSDLSLSCAASEVIHVVSANYGRLDATTCSAGKPEGQLLNTNCESSNSPSILIAACNNKQSCSVLAGNSVFGDPCGGTFKYLEVDYVCVPEDCDPGSSVCDPGTECTEATRTCSSELTCDTACTGDEVCKQEGMCIPDPQFCTEEEAASAGCSATERCKKPNNGVVSCTNNPNACTDELKTELDCFNMPGPGNSGPHQRCKEKGNSCQAAGRRSSRPFILKAQGNRRS